MALRRSGVRLPSAPPFFKGLAAGTNGRPWGVSRTGLEVGEHAFRVPAGVREQRGADDKAVVGGQADRDADAIADVGAGEAQ